MNDAARARRPLAPCANRKREISTYHDFRAPRPLPRPRPRPRPPLPPPRPPPRPPLENDARSLSRGRSCTSTSIPSRPSSAPVQLD